jgi:PLP dependent protein
MLEQHLSAVRQQIETAAVACGRQAATVQLLAVSKTQPASLLRAAFALGQTAFGENYLQEAREKQNQLSDLAIEWHFIGPIQSNKTREIAEHFSWVHSVDRLKIAHRLSEQRPAHLPPLHICLQVNIDDEATKSGVSLSELPTLVAGVSVLPRIKLRGLMAIPAPHESYADQLVAFQTLATAMADFPMMDTLSMGMSADMEAAIAAGATIVRVGTGIFGKRHVQ